MFGLVEGGIEEAYYAALAQHIQPSADSGEAAGAAGCGSGAGERAASWELPAQDLAAPALSQAEATITRRQVAQAVREYAARKSQGQPMSYGHCWRLIRRYALAADVLVVGPNGVPRPATGRDFRHGAAVNQVRQGVPLSEVQQQLGHARIDTTTIYTKLAARDRLAVHAAVAW